MPRWSELHRNGTGLVVLGILACCLACLPATASAQGSKSKKGADAEKKTGTIAEVQKKGKSATLVIEQADGDKFEVQVAAKTNFIVNGKGDVSFFKHGNMFVTSDEVVRNPANNYLHGKKFTIHLGGKGPGERVEQDPNNPEVCHIAGPVVDADDESFTFEAEGTPYRVGFDQGGIDISVESIDPEHAKVGAPVEVEGATRSGKFIPTAIVVNLDKPMSATEVFAGNEKKKSKTGSKTTSKKTTAKTDKSDKNADKGDDSADKKPANADPFGVLDSGAKKDAKKKPAPKKDKKSADGDMS